MVLDHNKYRPKHIYLENEIYFVTSRVYKEINYFNTNGRRNIFIKVFKDSIEKFNIDIFAWVLMDNHYHLLFKPNNKFRSAQFVTPDILRSDEMSETNFVTKYQIVEFIRKIHKDTSRRINKLDNRFGRKIWYQYWDRCIRDEADFYRHFNYIHNNPIKHKKVKNIEELHKYKYSSFNIWINKKGREWINSSFEDYPILDFTVEGD